MLRIDRVIWDAKAAEHIGRHGLDYDDVMHALNNFIAVQEGLEQRKLFFGQSVTGQ